VDRLGFERGEMPTRQRVTVRHGLAERMALASAAVSAGGSSLSFANNHEAAACRQDPAGDTRRLEEGEPGPAAEEPRADIIEYCAHFGPSLSLSVLTSEPTDPRADENWQHATFIGWFLDTTGNGQGDYYVDYSLDADGTLSAAVERITETGDNPVTCEVRADYTGLYSVSGIRPACLGNPTSLGIEVAVIYDTYGDDDDNNNNDDDAAVYFDAAPGGGVMAPVAIDTDPRATARLSGPTRVETAVAISQREFPNPAAVDVVYLARAFEPENADASPDAVAGGVLTGGPILLVPSTGPLPAAVRAEIDRLNPQRVVALGGAAAIDDPMLAQAATGRESGRLAGATRIQTAIAIARAQFGEGAEDVYLARAFGTLADAVVGGVLTGGPILLVPTQGDVPADVRAAIEDIDPDRVVALGGEAAIQEAVLRQAAGDRDIVRLAGAGRIQTATAISRYEFPGNAPVVYIARGDVFADALAGGVLTDGPVLLVPNEVRPADPAIQPEQRWYDREFFGAIPDEISRLAPDAVIALGGSAAVSDQVLALAADS
jgi:putative cell wall-binding protein